MQRTVSSAVKYLYAVYPVHHKMNHSKSLPYLAIKVLVQYVQLVAGGVSSRLVYYFTIDMTVGRMLQ